MKVDILKHLELLRDISPSTLQSVARNETPIAPHLGVSEIKRRTEAIEEAKAMEAEDQLGLGPDGGIGTDGYSKDRNVAEHWLDRLAGMSQAPLDPRIQAMQRSSGGIPRAQPAGPSPMMPYPGGPQARQPMSPIPGRSPMPGALPMPGRSPMPGRLPMPGAPPTPGRIPMPGMQGMMPQPPVRFNEGGGVSHPMDAALAAKREEIRLAEEELSQPNPRAKYQPGYTKDALQERVDNLKAELGYMKSAGGLATDSFSGLRFEDERSPAEIAGLPGAGSPFVGFRQAEAIKRFDDNARREEAIEKIKGYPVSEDPVSETGGAQNPSLSSLQERARNLVNPATRISKIGDALTMAGLRIMSEDSPSALQNIGRGATHGLNQYLESEDDETQLELEALALEMEAQRGADLRRIREAERELTFEEYLEIVVDPYKFESLTNEDIQMYREDYKAMLSGSSSGKTGVTYDMRSEKINPDGTLRGS